MDFLTYLGQHFPIRKTAAQKQAFRTWVAEEIHQMGYKVKVETTVRGKHHNIVAGDPERAAVVFTAHYDTGAKMPLPDLVMPRNIPVSIAYLLLNVLLLLIPSVLVLLIMQGFFGNPQLALLSMVATFAGLMLLITYGPACKRSANGGDSGVAALLSLMAAIPEQERGKLAFILFDAKETSRGGSKGYARDHQQVQYTRLMVNLDCVGTGDQVLCISTELARKCTGHAALERILSETPGLTAHFFSSRTSMMGGDQKSFKCGVALLSATQSTGIGFLIPALRTNRDTKCRPENIAWFTEALSSYVHTLVGEKKESSPN